MTPQQRDQFNQFACIARCIIRLTEIRGPTISADQFCAQFQNRFVDAANKYGFLLTSQIAEVTRDLHLGSYFQTYRRYCAVEYHFNHEHRDVLVLSEINLAQDQTNFVEHCSLLREMDHQHFRIWTPYSDGTAAELDLDPSLWEKKACHAVILRQ